MVVIKNELQNRNILLIVFIQLIDALQIIMILKDIQ